MHRLRHMHLKPGGEYAAPVFRAGSCRDRSGGDAPAAIRRQGSYLADQRIAVLPRHGEITQENIGGILLQGLEGLSR